MMRQLRSISLPRRYLAFGASSVAVPLATVVTAPILAQTLGVAGRGALASATAALLLVVSAATVGIPEAITYLSASRTLPSRLVARTGFTLLLLAGALGSAGLLLYWSTGLVTGTAAAALLVILPAACPTLGVAALRASAAAHEQWTVIAAEKSLNALCQVAGIVALAITDSLTVVNGALVIGYAPVIAGAAYIVRPREQDATQARPSAALRSIAAYGPRVWLGSIFGVVLTRVDQVLMVPLSDSTQLGLYVVAVTIGEVPLIVSRTVRDVMLAKDSRAPSLAQLARASRYTFMTCSLIVVVTIATMTTAVPALFGEDFVGVYGPLTVTLVGVLLGVPGSVAGAGLMARNRPGLRSWSIALAASANVLLLVVLVPSNGAMGAAWATLAGNVIAGFGNLLAMRFLFGVPVLAFFAPVSLARQTTG